MSDEGFHEIQLNGKQLVFLFMAATVVSVVIFLCGVMVGRGVRTHQAATEANDFGPAAAVDGRPPSLPSAPARDPASGPGNPAPKASTPPPDPAEDSSYYDQLTKAEPEKDSKVSQPTEPERKAVAVPAPVTAAPPSAVTGAGFVVQVVALRDRTEADAIVKRLAGKGYQAFVVNPVPGKPPVYKVQVGRFAERGEAEKTAARLKSQEQYSPWVTR